MKKIQCRNAIDWKRRPDGEKERVYCPNVFLPKKPGNRLCEECRDKMKVATAALNEVFEEGIRMAREDGYRGPIVFGIPGVMEEAGQRLRDKAIETGANNRKRLRLAQEKRWKAERLQIAAIVKRSKKLHADSPLVYGIRKARAQVIATRSGVDFARVMRILEKNRA